VAKDPRLYQRPVNVAQVATVPRLASWDKAGSPGLLELAEWLAEVDRVTIEMHVEAIARPLAVELSVGLAPGVEVTAGGRDLDNYLLPVAQRLGPEQITAAFATKRPGGSSYLAISTAVSDTIPPPTGRAVLLSGSASGTAWKQTLHEDLRSGGLALIRPGPVWLTVAISTGPGRVWTNLWKPLIDSLGPLLGEDPEQPFHPYDDRVVNLGLHHQRDPALGHDVVVHLWWGPAPPA